MSEYTIGEPTEVMPRNPNRKHADLIAKAQALTNGVALPLTFKDRGAATAFLTATVNSFKAQGVRSQQRDNVIYLSKREVKS